VENVPDPSLAVLISGRGSNLRAIAESELGASIAVVISNRADAQGLVYARERGLRTLVLPHEGYQSRDEYDRALANELKRHRVGLVCLAGFMRILGPEFCAAFPNAILNIHPSLLPSFPGTRAQRQALEHGVKVSGATVHFAAPSLDAGPIILQEAVAVEDDDTEETLSARILAVEHRVYPRAIRLVISGGWRIAGRRVLFGPTRHGI
jgi:phosphoribosylglycinamide formyltransferase-1